MTAITAFVIAQYVVFLVFDTWWFLRFLLPCWPFIALALAGVLIGHSARRSSVQLLAVWVVVALGLYGIRTATKVATFELWRGERAVVDVSHAVRDATPDRSVVFALIHTGTLRYYGGRVTLRYDSLPEDWLDRAVDWLQSRGVGAYALLERDEIPTFKRRFQSAQAIGRLDKSDVLIYSGVRTAVLYDLTKTRPGPARLAPIHDLAPLRAAPPIPLPPLSLK